MKPDVSEGEPKWPAVSTATFESLVGHWATARLDGPLEVIRRFDEAAKQLIAVGAALQALFFAVLALGDFRTHLPKWAVPAILAPLVILVFCAAKVICTVPLKMEAIDTYLLLKRAAGPNGDPEDAVTKAVEKWCHTVDSIARTKHRWLFAANMAFLVSSVAAIGLLLSLARM